jgi:hypothetical protein
MAANPKPVRKNAKVTTRSARTPDGKKVTYQTSKTQKTPVTGGGGRPVLDKAGKGKMSISKLTGNYGEELFSLNSVKTNARMKKAVRNGEFPASVSGEGKGKNPAVKAGKEGPSFKKKKP